METPIQNNPEPQSNLPERGRVWRIFTVVLTLHAAILGSVVLIQGCSKSDVTSMTDTSSVPKQAEDQMAQEMTSNQDKSNTVFLSPNTEVLIPEEHLQGAEIVQTPLLTQIENNPVEAQPQPVEIPKIEPTPEVVPVKVPKPTTYSVQKNDTLTKIAKKHSVSVQELVQANKMTAKSQLKVGQKLMIPVSQKELAKTDKPSVGKEIIAPKRVMEKPQNHLVKSGETPTSIAKKYGVTVQSLLKTNHISDAKKIRVNQKLIIPSSKVADKTPTLRQEQDLVPASMEEAITMGQEIRKI